MSRPLSDLRAALFTAYVVFLLCLTAPLLWIALLLARPGRPADRLVRRWSRIIVRLSGCRLRVSGIDNLPRGDAAMLVSNHRSYVDSVVLMAAVPGAYRFVANHGVLTWPIVGTIVRKAGHLTVDRSVRAARLACSRQMTDVLIGGGSLLVYPEGTTGRLGGLLPFRLGAFRAAVDAGRPIVAVALSGTGTIWERGRWLLRRGRIDVTIHEPIAPVGRDRPEMVRIRHRARRQMASSLPDVEPGH